MTTLERVEFPADRLEAESVVVFYFSDKNNKKILKILNTTSPITNSTAVTY